MNNGAEISTEAVGERSAANGGNITLHVRDFLHLVSSDISTSVKGETGNGGNITIDPLLVILEQHSQIKADAIAGHGGDITINADQFIQSSDSTVEATSQRGISGTVTINGLVTANGALAVLSTQLRSRIEILREACVSRGGQPQSTLVEAGRGGLPPDPESTLPALYIAGRDLNPNPQSEEKSTEAKAPLHTTVRLTMHCNSADNYPAAGLRH
jgi:large exoprotein involved in heme utilization and adhesion